MFMDPSLRWGYSTFMNRYGLYVLSFLCVLGLVPQARAASLPIYPLDGTLGPVYVALAPDDIMQLRKTLDQAWAHGLNPARYDAPVSKPHAVLKATVDYLSDLSGPRLDLKIVGLRPHDWRVPSRATRAADVLARAANPFESVLFAGPKSPLYTALQRELAVLMEKVKAGQGARAMTPITFGGQTVRPGDMHHDVAILRARLGTALPPGTPPTRYDDTLARAVMMIQRHHRIKPDGVLGPATLGLFRQTYQGRMEQVIVNLERLRWMPDLGPRYVLVNIPAATLWAVKDGQIQFEMPVLVGRPDRPTRQFQADMTGVRLNPTWTAPDTIVRDDILPALQHTPHALRAKGMAVYQRDARGADGAWTKIDPTGVNWAAVTPDTVRGYRFVQPAGPHNVLGRVRVLMPNPYDIYLHDTDTPDRFDTDDRNVSSGCVRLARPIDMARFILDGTPGGGDDQIQAILAAPDQTVDVPAPESFPVIFTYQTAWISPGGNLVITDDMYNEDARVYKALVKAGYVPSFIK
jgi:murein L,D-transpeptidase YcbB/YkuD